MKKLTILFLTILAVTCYFSVLGQKPAIITDNEPGWKHIGQTKASFQTESESIEVLGADEFTAIKLKVTGAPVHIERLQVFYESGDMEEIDVRSDIKSDEETKSFRLEHPDRDINKVAFTYKTVANADGEKADVNLYGLKTDQPKGKDTYRDDAEEVENDVERAAEDAEEDVEEAANDIDREADEAEREIEAETEETESDLERAAEDVGDGISEGVNDAASAIKDKKVKDKVGPGGETAYVDDHGKYYYINNEGTKVYITKLQLKDKDDN